MTEKESVEKPSQLDLTALEIEQIIGLFMGILTAKAWQYMGLQLTPGKSETVKDMAKASTTIDCISYLADKIVPLMPESEASSLGAMITDLKINYARNA